MTALQDVLGLHQDSVVAQQLLMRLARQESMPRHSARDFSLAMGQLTQWNAQRAEESRAEFFRLCQKYGVPSVDEHGPLPAALKRVKGLYGLGPDDAL